MAKIANTDQKGIHKKIKKIKNNDYFQIKKKVKTVFENKDQKI